MVSWQHIHNKELEVLWNIICLNNCSDLIQTLIIAYGVFFLYVVLNSCTGKRITNAEVTLYLDHMGKGISQ